jgi:hypothetical protein
MVIPPYSIVGMVPGESHASILSELAESWKDEMSWRTADQYEKCKIGM